MPHFPFVISETPCGAGATVAAAACDKNVCCRLLLHFLGLLIDLRFNFWLATLTP